MSCNIDNSKTVRIESPCGYKGSGGEKKISTNVSEIAFIPLQNKIAVIDEIVVDSKLGKVINKRKSDYIDNMWIFKIKF